MGDAVAGRIEWSEPLAELEAYDGMLPCPLGLLDPVEFGVEKEEEVFVLEGEVAEVAPGLLVVCFFAQFEQHLCLADQREQGEFLGDAGERELAVPALTPDSPGVLIGIPQVPEFRTM